MSKHNGGEMDVYPHQHVSPDMANNADDPMESTFPMIRTLVKKPQQCVVIDSNNNKEVKSYGKTLIMAMPWT